MEHCFYAFIDLSTKKQLRDDGECSCHFSSSTNTTATTTTTTYTTTTTISTHQATSPTSAR